MITAALVSRRCSCCAGRELTDIISPRRASRRWPEARGRLEHHCDTMWSIISSWHPLHGKPSSLCWRLCPSNLCPVRRCGRFQRLSTFAVDKKSRPELQRNSAFWNLLSNIVDPFHPTKRVVQSDLGDVPGNAEITKVSLRCASAVVRSEPSNVKSMLLEAASDCREEC